MNIHVLDTLVNFVSRLGTTSDKSTYNRYAFNELDQRELELAYRGDWIARKVVNIPAQDATREWRSWQAEDDQIELLEAEEERLGLQRKTKLALIKARLYGGSALVMGCGADCEKELLPEAVRQNDLKYVHVVSRHEIHAQELVRNVLDPHYGEPRFYDVTPTGGVPVRIHPSRVVRFLGNELPDLTMQTQSEGWGDSVLQALDDAIKNVASTNGGVAAMVTEAKMDVLKIPDFMANVGTEEYKSRMLERLSLVNQSKSLISTIITDKEEEWQRITTSFASLPDILKMYMLIACGAADIPSTRMLGQSAMGLNATGEGDLRNYYDATASHQKTEIGPSLRRLDEVLVRSALGERPEEVYYEWRPLWQMDNQQRADLALKKAQAFQVDVTLGVVHPEVLAKARLNQLVEDGTYPGIEAAMADYENDGVLEYDPEAAAQFTSSKTGRDGDGDGRVGEAELSDYDPNQPRDPEGEGGGQWVSSGGGGGSSPRELKNFAKKHGVFLEMSRLDSKTWHLEGIERETGKPGSGAEVMRAIAKEADASGKTVVLWPSGRTNSPQFKTLTKYYKEFGFKSFDKWPLDKHDMDNNGMIRYPKNYKKDGSVQDAEPRSLYVSRDVLNADEIREWAESVGLENVVDDMHVTVVYSRNKIDWMRFKEDWNIGNSDGEITIAPGGPRLVERLGPTRESVVLMFSSSSLCYRHESIQQGGASHDWPEYQPHVTICEIPESVDVSKIEPYRGRIVLGPEIWREISE